MIQARIWHGLRMVAGLQASAGTDLLPSIHGAFALFLPGAKLALHARLQPAARGRRCSKPWTI